MGFLRALVGSKKKQSQPFYTAEEVEVIERGWSNFQKMANDELAGQATFHPDVVPILQRKLAADALVDWAKSEWAFTDEIPANWKTNADTLLKAWAGHLNPMVLLDLGDLLTRVGHRTEAKETFQAVLLFPTYADTFYGGKQDFGFIIDSAKESLEELA